MFNGRLEAENPPASAWPLSGGLAASLTLLSPIKSSGLLSSVSYNQAYVPGPRFGSMSS